VRKIASAVLLLLLAAPAPVNGKQTIRLQGSVSSHVRIARPSPRVLQGQSARLLTALKPECFSLQMVQGTADPHLDITVPTTTLAPREPFRILIEQASPRQAAQAAVDYDAVEAEYARLGQQATVDNSQARLLQGDAHIDAIALLNQRAGLRQNIFNQQAALQQASLAPLPASTPFVVPGAAACG
jgi:hypothetical protein